MVMFPDRNPVDVLFRIKTAAPGLGLFQIRCHFFGNHPFLNPQEDCRIPLLIRFQDVIAFVLRIVHAEVLLDIFRQRMNLQGKVSSLHGIQKIETDGELGTETPVHPLSQELMGMGQDQIDTGKDQAGVPDGEAEAVFLGNTVKAPGQVTGFCRYPQSAAEPLPAPYARVEIRLCPEGAADSQVQRMAIRLSRDHFRIAGLIRVHHQVNPGEQGRLQAVGNAPQDKITIFVFCQERIVPVFQSPVSPAGPIPELDFPSGDIGIQQRIPAGKQRSPRAAYDNQAVPDRGDFLSGRFKLFRIKTIRQLTAGHITEDPVFPLIFIQTGEEMIPGKQQIIRVDQPDRAQRGQAAENLCPIDARIQFTYQYVTRCDSSETQFAEHSIPAPHRPEFSAFQRNGRKTVILMKMLIFHLCFLPVQTRSSAVMAV